MYMFSYFKDTDERLFLAESEDGYSWRDFAGGEAVFQSKLGSGLIRDPFILPDPKRGLYHLVWTDGWSSRSIGYARSADLLHWEEAKLIPVMETKPDTQNTWAPEIFFDTAAQAYRIIWSSTVRPGPRNHRIWSVTTADFVHFSEAKLFFDPGYNVIDACVIDREDHYFMLFKDERGVNEPGTDYKAIRSCRIAKEAGDRPAVTFVSELLTEPLTEGPALYAVEGPNGREWIMLVDGFQKLDYNAYRSSDLVRWESAGELVQLPSEARHGAVFIR
ncbi:hypothetical protein BBD42_05010 [Paenibacillus sp. BIHB 4019]|uniref:Uncharacterized protein n=1 Tax=Paenibacillus sp. BIHB 4019 TaxID=1870819 RepID=A0A1B2DDW9_9BACL|nr:glycoside hydrolase family 43 protein [Paenibacillus sp. BIHB 4019]ANY65899.1 hypothetical protein BBD42_05010 [Paenibacillus sp. BIHB 4019]